MNSSHSISDHTRELLCKALDAALRASETIMKHRTIGVTATLKSDQSPVTEADEAANAIIMSHLETTHIPVLSEEGAHWPFAERNKWKRLWIVDPLDGTKSFIRGKEEFTVNIALVEEGVPVLGIIAIPARDTVYFGGTMAGGCFRLEGFSDNQNISAATPLPDHRTEAHTVLVSSSNTNEDTSAYLQRLRDLHPNLRVWPLGSAVKFCLLAEGLADGYVRFSPCMEWDTAAGHALIAALGFSMIDNETGLEMTYNRAKLLNNSFVVQRPEAR